MPFKYELQNLISGAGAVTKGNLIQTISRYIRRSQEAGTNAEKEEFIKEKEAEIIIAFAKKNSFFYSGPDSSRYLTEGAEQKIYLAADNLHVIN